jgi:hypothetical protein
VATAEADRKKREGEEKLSELEARLAQAKANEHLMDPYQRQRLREYEYQLANARYGFFGGDWLTALLLFEALDNDYMYMGDPFLLLRRGLRRRRRLGRRRLGRWRLGRRGFRRRRFRRRRLLIPNPRMRPPEGFLARYERIVERGVVLLVRSGTGPGCLICLSWGYFGVRPARGARWVGDLDPVGYASGGRACSPQRSFRINGGERTLS